MKKVTLLCTTLIFLFLSGCIPSLHSIVDDHNRVTDDRILGDWKLEEGISFEPKSFSVKSDDPADQKEGEELMQAFVDSIRQANSNAYSIWTFERAANLVFKYNKNPEGTTYWTYRINGGGD